MVERKPLLIILILTLVSLSALLAPDNALAAPARCTSIELASDLCPVVTAEAVEDAVVLNGRESTNGFGDEPPRYDTPAKAERDGTTRGAGSAPAPADPNAPPYVIEVIRDAFTVNDPATGPAVGPVTLDDLASFRPTPGVGHMEPMGWTVTGLPTNFWAEAGAQVHLGTLLDRPASVRFTPRTYRWTFGDGASAVIPVRGASWRASGVEEFAPTPTSHIYRALGTFTVNLTIEFGAEYRFDDGPWTSVSGVIRLPANSLSATVGTASTVLVGRDCIGRPTGPGC